MATPHGVELRAELLVVPAPLFHPKHTNTHTSAHYRQHMATTASTQTSQVTHGHIQLTRSPPSFFDKFSKTQQSIPGAEDCLQLSASPCALVIQCQCVYVSFV